MNINKKEIKEIIENFIKDGKTSKARDLFNDNFNDCKYNLDLYLIKATLEYMENDIEKARNTLTEIYYKYEFNIDINYNLWIINYGLGNYDDAATYLIKAIFLNTKKEAYLEEEMNKLKNISKERLQKILLEIKNLFENRNKDFPLKDSNSHLIAKRLNINNKSYYTGIYDYYFLQRDGVDFTRQSSTMYNVKTEIFQAKKCKMFKHKESENFVLPIMCLDENTNIKLNTNKDIIELNNLLPERYYYYKFNKDDEIKVKADKNIVVANPIRLKKDNSKPLLILNIFVDGLSQKYLEENDLEKSMPNTYKFFKPGTICNNAYVSGEWTYVSLASFFTGKYTANHRIYNPQHSTNSLYEQELYSEVINNNGYFSAKIDGDWRSSPISGYVKGFDRTIYQPSVRGMHCDEVINETIEHLEAFKDTNNFVWLCIPDLHDIADEFETRISTQINTDVKNRIINKSNETSVRKTYDCSKIIRYGAQLKRLDTFLGTLYDYIQRNYDENEFLISLFADHGQGFLVKSDNFLEEERSKVPMMFRGENIKKGVCDELIQGLDLFPIILNSLNIKNFNVKDGNIPIWFGGSSSREYTITESIFPNSPYRACINNFKFKFFFETKSLCQLDGRFSIDKYNIKLIDKSSEEEVTEKYAKIVEEYTNIVLNHIEEYVIVN